MVGVSGVHVVVVVVVVVGRTLTTRIFGLNRLNSWHQAERTLNGHTTRCGPATLALNLRWDRKAMLGRVANEEANEEVNEEEVNEEVVNEVRVGGEEGH